MEQEESPTVRFEARVTPVASADLHTAMTQTARIMSGIDVLPSAPAQAEAGSAASPKIAGQDLAAAPGIPCLLRLEEIEALVRQGLTVTVTGFAEGPVDSGLIMTDEQARTDLIARIGEARLRAGEVQ